MTFFSDWLNVRHAPPKYIRHFAYVTVLASALYASDCASAQTSVGAPLNATPPAATSTPEVTLQAGAPQTIPAAPTAEAATQVAPKLPASPHLIGSGDTERVLVIGDSQAQGLAGGLRWLYRTNRKVRILDHSKISTGLVSVAFYNWPDEVHKLAATEHADVAVIMFGANDRPPVRVHGTVDQKMLENFTKIYSARVRDIMTTLQNAHIPVIWVGHPIVHDETFSADMAILNDIFQNQAAQNKAQFVPLWPVFAEDDHYSAYGEGVDGVKIRLRADDGIHLTPPGYQKAAKILEPLILAHSQHGMAQENVKLVTAPASTTPLVQDAQQAQVQPKAATPVESVPAPVTSTN